MPDAGPQNRCAPCSSSRRSPVGGPGSKPRSRRLAPTRVQGTSGRCFRQFAPSETHRRPSPAKRGGARDPVAAFSCLYVRIAHALVLSASTVRLSILPDGQAFPTKGRNGYRYPYNKEMPLRGINVQAALGAIKLPVALVHVFWILQGASAVNTLRLRLVRFRSDGSDGGRSAGQGADPPGQSAGPVAGRVDAGLRLARRHLDRAVQRRRGPAAHAAQRRRQRAGVLAGRHADRLHQRPQRQPAGLRHARRGRAAQADHASHRRLHAARLVSRRPLAAGQRRPRPLLARRASASSACSATSARPRSCCSTTTAAAGSLSPDGKQLLFTREGPAWWRKGYHGSQAAQVWMYDLETQGVHQARSTTTAAASGRCGSPTARRSTTSAGRTARSTCGSTTARRQAETAAHAVRRRRRRLPVHLPATARRSSSATCSTCTASTPAAREPPQKIEIFDDGDTTARADRAPPADAGDRRRLLGRRPGDRLHRRRRPVGHGHRAARAAAGHAARPRRSATRSSPPTASRSGSSATPRARPTSGGPPAATPRSTGG